MDCQDYITESVERKKGQHLQREERSYSAFQERRLLKQSHCQSNRMFTNHRRKRAKAWQTAPKEQQGPEARILGKAGRGSLQG